MANVALAKPETIPLNGRCASQQGAALAELNSRAKTERTETDLRDLEDIFEITRLFTLSSPTKKRPMAAASD